MKAIEPSNKTEIWILNVERGLSTLIKTSQNDIVIYDVGSTKDFSPLKTFNDERIFVKLGKEKYFDQVIISHPHQDHISDLDEDNVKYLGINTELITCQNDKTKDQIKGHQIDFNRISNQESGKVFEENLKNLYKERRLPLQTFVNKKVVDEPNIKIGYYYITHDQANELFPKNDQEYSNSLSIVLYISHGNHSLLFTGDITPMALELIIAGKCEKRFTDYSIKQSEDKKISWSSKTTDQPSLKTLLKNGISFLVAPHHGLESGYSEALFDELGENKPKLILISEKRKSGENQGKLHQNYQNGKCSTGLKVNSKDRWSLSTANDGHIRITLTGNDFSIKTGKELNEVFN